MRSMLKGPRPSPAMIVAVLALCVSLTGTGVAATISALNKGEKKQVKKLARKQADKRITKRAPRLTVGNANALGGAPPAAFQSRVRWVTVRDNGSVFRQSGGITVSHPSTGIYYVDFGEPVGDKVALATPMISGSTGGTSIIAAPCGGGADSPGCAAGFGDNPNVILVREDGSSGTGPVNIAFNLALVS